ncbi:MAG: O-antigen polysaccharide polymerase Wzy [Burkholderiales bacterium]|nr:O-antigen polysaccharide polymerase Wzy [Burkholderiales bacterium]
MKNAGAMQAQRTIPVQRLWVALIAVVIGLSVWSGYKAESAGDWLCFLVILVSGTIPCLVWLAFWRTSLPIMPLFAAMHVLNYGPQFLTGGANVFRYGDEERLVAALTVGGFLVAATLSWLLVSSARIRLRPAVRPMDAALINRLLPLGFLGAAAINWLGMTGDIYQLQNLQPVARAIGGTIMNICAFLLGALWADRALRLQTRTLCAVLFVTGIFVTLPSVHLYSSLFVIAVFIVGYVFGTRRIPLATIALVFAVYSVLQAGKPAIREHYWHEATPVTSVLELPGFVAEWAREGLAAFVSPSEGRTVYLDERVGLTHMLLRVQSMTPETVEYLYGETYALVPRLILPRLIDPDKPSVNTGLIMLNLRYGILTVEEAAQTSVGWGLISEAFANFGYAGVAAMGILVGVVIALVSTWASGAPALSLRTAVGIVLMAVLFNLEGDFALIVTTLFQSIVAALALVFALGAVRRRKSPLARGPGSGTMAW